MKLFVRRQNKFRFPVDAKETTPTGGGCKVWYLAQLITSTNTTRPKITNPSHIAAHRKTPKKVPKMFANKKPRSNESSIVAKKL